MKKEYLFLITLGLLLIGGTALTSIIMANKDTTFDRFEVTGSGTVYAKADIATLTVGLKTEAKQTAVEATSENTKKMNSVIKNLKELGIEEKDIKTTDYSLQPVYDWKENQGQVLKGYEIYQNVNIKIRDLNKISDIITKTTEQGANQIGNINFTIDDEYNLKNEARKLAISKAQEKAKMIAEQTGMKLGEIKSVYEYEQARPVENPYSNAKTELLAADSGGGAEISSDIQSGQNEVKIEVTLSYEVK